MTALPFEDSRRLTGANLYFGDAGAVLETLGDALNDGLLDAWRERVNMVCHELAWPLPVTLVRRHPGGAALAFSAPIDQLYSATEVNEWAWLATLAELRGIDANLHAPGHPAAWDDASALHTLRVFAAGEQSRLMRALVQAAESHGLTVLVDEEMLSIGAGRGVRSWPLAELPAVEAVPWDALHDIPVVLVTGSNGKTTTVRLIAAMAHAHGWHTGHSSTDGVIVEGVAIGGGDFSGPAGARLVLRHPEVEAAVLETARGGLLRRGIAVQHANVAVVTNVSDDHFGEYGIHDLHGLAEVKLTIARVLDADGLLVVNADDPVLSAQAALLPVSLGWFAFDDAHPLLRARREQRGSTCGVRDGHLHVFHRNVDHDLGAVARMPLSFAGSASYNIANIAAASLAASALGIPAQTIAGVLAHFGSAHADNPGRLQHWRFGSLQVFVDYAHNPEGLRGLLGVATKSIGEGRLGLVLGQAGNREDADIRELATVAASFHPQRVVLKDIDGFMRGREAGEVAGVLRDALLQNAVPSEAIVECLDELDAVRGLLAWAQDGDVLVLPTHGALARTAVVELLDELQAMGWLASA
jgi:cyanophycin synthetase